MALAYFTDAELVAFAPATETNTLEERAAMRDLVEQALEDACDVAFVPRTATETFSGSGGRLLVLPTTLVRTITTAADDGTPLDLADVKITGRAAYRPGGWPQGTANLAVTWEHGHDLPPLRVKRAAMILTKVWLLKGPVDDRATQLAGDYGTINLATPGMFGATFGVPEVDAVVTRYGVRRAGMA